MTTMTTETRHGRPPTDDYFDLVRRFPLVPVRDAQHLAAAHEVIDELSIIDEDRLTAGQAAYLSVLSDLTAAYERPVFDALMSETRGLDVVRLMMETHGLTAHDIGAIAGAPDLGEAIVNGEHRLDPHQAMLLGQRFGLPDRTFMD